MAGGAFEVVAGVVFAAVAAADATVFARVCAVVRGAGVLDALSVFTDFVCSTLFVSANIGNTLAFVAYLFVFAEDARTRADTIASFASFAVFALLAVAGILGALAVAADFSGFTVGVGLAIREDALVLNTKEETRAVAIPGTFGRTLALASDLIAHRLGRTFHTGAWIFDAGVEGCQADATVLTDIAGSAVVGFALAFYADVSALALHAEAGIFFAFSVNTPLVVATRNGCARGNTLVVTGSTELAGFALYAAVGWAVVGVALALLTDLVGFAGLRSVAILGLTKFVDTDLLSGTIDIHFAGESIDTLTCNATLILGIGTLNGSAGVVDAVRHLRHADATVTAGLLVAGVLLAHGIFSVTVVAVLVGFARCCSAGIFHTFAVHANFTRLTFHALARLDALSVDGVAVFSLATGFSIAGVFPARAIFAEFGAVLAFGCLVGTAWLFADPPCVVGGNCRTEGGASVAIQCFVKGAVIPCCLGNGASACTL